MTIIHIVLLIIWVIVVLVWTIYAYLNFGQIRPMIGLRPGVRRFYFLQLLLALLFFGLALWMIFWWPESISRNPFL